MRAMIIGCCICNTLIPITPLSSLLLLFQYLASAETIIWLVSQLNQTLG